MTPFPLAAQLLTDLAELGVEVQALGGALRYRPRSAMPPDLLTRLQAIKPELLGLLNTEAAIMEQRESVERLWKDSDWRSAWERRFKSARYADFASLRRVLDLVLEQAEEHHRRRDWSAFDSTCRHLHRLAVGELWDEAERTASDLRSDLTAWLI